MKASVVLAAMLALAAGVDAVAASEQAQARTGQESSEALSGVVVEAGRNDRPRQFVRGVTRLSASGFVSRWVVPICPLVAGLTPAQDRLVEKRIGAAAREAHAPMAANGCKPNLTIVFADEPEVFIVKARAAKKIALVGASIPAIHRFRTSDSTFRVWRQIEDVPAYGVMPGDENGTPIFHSFTGSRVRSAIGSGILSATIVIDKPFVVRQKLKPTTIAAYLSMVALSDIDEAFAGPEFPSVLSAVWDASPGVTGLTAWDRAYLKALYASAQARQGSTELGYMGRLMNAELNILDQ